MVVLGDEPPRAWERLSFRDWYYRVPGDDQFYGVPGVSDLLGNAIRYSAEGRVVVRDPKTGCVVTCVVRDIGAGIPPEMLAEVFDQMATDPDKERTVLALPFSTDHGGTVNAESTQGSGATFSFTIPTLPGN